MKITLNLPVRSQVGVRYTDIFDYYHDGRPDPAPTCRVKRLHAVNIEPVTVFDYDFKAKRRALATGRLTWALVEASVVAPAVGIAVIPVAIACRLVTAVVTEAATLTGEVGAILADTHRDITSGIRSHLADIFQ